VTPIRHASGASDTVCPRLARRSRAFRPTQAGEGCVPSSRVSRDRARHRWQGPLRPQAGFSIDTAGAIARALERAYAQGFADAQAPPSPPFASEPSEHANSPMKWVLIPPRPRNAFWTICLFTLGRDPAVTPDGAGRLYLTALPSGQFVRAAEALAASLGAGASFAPGPV
jgi:hypothetical protein